MITDRDELVLRGLLAEAGEETWQGPDLADVVRRGSRRQRNHRTARRAAGALAAAVSVLVLARVGGPPRTPATAAGSATGGVGGLLPAGLVSVLVAAALAAGTTAAGLLLVRLARQLGRPLRRPARVALVGLLTVVLLAAVSQVALRPASMPSASMEPALRVGSRFVVAVRVPGLTTLRRGDVVLFRAPVGWLPPQPDGSRGLLVKRVVGLPGERVACCDAQGRVTVDGVRLDEPYLRTGEAPSDRAFDLVVPQGGLFLLGDHRSVSEDSRSHVADGSSGVPLDDVVGVVVAGLP